MCVCICLRRMLLLDLVDVSFSMASSVIHFRSLDQPADPSHWRCSCRSSSASSRHCCLLLSVSSSFHHSWCNDDAVLLFFVLFFTLLRFACSRSLPSVSLVVIHIFPSRTSCLLSALYRSSSLCVRGRSCTSKMADGINNEKATQQASHTHTLTLIYTKNHLNIQMSAAITPAMDIAFFGAESIVAVLVVLQLPWQR